MIQELTKELKNLTGDAMRQMHTCIPGKVVSFDAAKCEAMVLPYGMFRKPDGSSLPYPQISGVPVLFPQGSSRNASITWPVKSGDECLLLFSEQPLDSWRSGGGESRTGLRFDMTSAVAIAGLFSKPPRTIQEAVSQDALVISVQHRDGGEGRLLSESRATFSKAGAKLEARAGANAAKVEVTESSVEVDAGGGDITLNAANVTISASGSVTVSAGSGISMNAPAINLN